MNDSFPVFLLIALFLVPMIPAFVFFKWLPSSADATGPFKGLTIKLGGAFAAYFVLLLVGYTVTQPLLKAREAAWSTYVTTLEKNVYVSWRITGKMQFSGDTQDITPDQVVCFIRPPDLHIQPDSSFRFDIPVLVKSDGTLDPPMLIFEATGYSPTAITLDKIDPQAKTQVFPISTPIIMLSTKTLPAYKPKNAEAVSAQPTTPVP